MIAITRPLQRLARRLYLISLVPLFALVLLLVLWTAVYYHVSEDRASAVRDAVAASQSLTRTLADHTSFTLRQADHATQLFKLKYEESNGGLRLNEFMRRRGLLDSVLPLKLALPIALIDAQGRVIDSANAYFSENLAKQAFFRALAVNSSDTALVDTPMLDAGSKHWTIRLVRRLNDAQGRFAGAIIIHVDPTYFVDDYDRLNLDEQGALMLVARDSGLTVGRIGEQWFRSEHIVLRKPDTLQQASEELLLDPPVDTTARIYSYRELPRFPLLAVVGVSRAGALARFEHRRLTYIYALLAASVLIVGFTALLMRQGARLRHSIRQATEAQALLRAAHQASLDSVLLLKAWRAAPGKPVADFIFADVNERAADMLGKPRCELLGQRVLQQVPLLRDERFFKCFVQVMETGQPMEDEFELTLASGGTRWLRHQVVPITDGVAVTSRDISARKHDELALQDNRSFLQSLIDHLPVLVYVKSARPENFGQMEVWNKAAEDITGHLANDVIGKTDCQAFPPDFGLHDAEDDRAILAERGVIDRTEKPLRLADGSLHYLRCVSVPVFDEQQQIEHILCIAEDISQRRQQELQLRQKQAELTAVNDASPLGLVRMDRQRRCTYVNRTFESITGLPRAAALGAGWSSAVHPDDYPLLHVALEQLTRTQAPFQATLRCLQRHGKLVWVSVKIAPILIDDQIEGYVGSLDDITTLRESEVALLESEARLRTIADTLPAMIAYIDADQVYRFLNIAYEREFGLTGRQALGRSVRETVGEARYRTIAPYIARVLAGETLSFEEEDQKEGIESCMEVIYIPQIGEDKLQVVGFHVMRQDITVQKREKQRLLKLAQVDALTGLSNRAGFQQKLSDAMHASRQQQHLMAVMYMDIDHFKHVNDTHGHGTGDALLRAFAQRLTQTMRVTDIVARLGGDEFTIVMEQIARPYDAVVLAEKIVAAMQQPFELDGITVRISASIGLAFYRDEDISPAVLLQRADVLLYQAKQDGRNTYRAGVLTT
ncbi:MULTISPECIES: PAS domain S-box protein [unclassified Janthinobacterium]|uniref:PAS domain S-box protein n=1 Tax=unclassified Janthinobacterium TaxID=2610881 RepID=UPI001A19055E|nr:PAS domain S-box protein [Janthinobacterium sp. CG_23.4]MDH6157333.1 diguanylate cyclase (GGDEF)-like protein/PAS domain S-box-containing protein [Janthinobacterium sp. CG_23.4]